MPSSASDCVYAAEGKALVRFQLLVNEKGVVESVWSLENFGQGERCLAKWVKAIKKWKYSPFIYHGKAVAFLWEVTLSFRTKDNPT